MTGSLGEASRSRVDRNVTEDDYPASVSPSEGVVHVDVKKLGRIPTGGGHRGHGREATRKGKCRRMGYAYLHSAIDDHSRLAYTEVLCDEKDITTAAS